MLEAEKIDVYEMPLEASPPPSPSEHSLFADTVRTAWVKDSYEVDKESPMARDEEDNKEDEVPDTMPDTIKNLPDVKRIRRILSKVMRT